MKLLLRREQRSGLLGKRIFCLSVRGTLTDEERADIQKYKLADTVIFQRYAGAGPEDTALGSFARWLQEVTITARDLEYGRIFETSSITEMLGAEAIIKEAAYNFKAILEAASTFGNEEVLEL